MSIERCHYSLNFYKVFQISNLQKISILTTTFIYAYLAVYNFVKYQYLLRVQFLIYPIIKVNWFSISVKVFPAFVPKTIILNNQLTLVYVTSKILKTQSLIMQCIIFWIFICCPSKNGFWNSKSDNGNFSRICRQR